MSLKQQLKENKTTIGSWITLGHSAIAEIMARAGFDWLVIDMEHSVIEISQAQQIIQAIDGAGIPTIVRLTSNDENLIKRVMDAGAHGIMVPNVNSAADAARAVAATYYPPKGKRGVGLARAQGYGASFKDYCRWLDDNAVVIVMIEHIDGVNVADEILAVDGVDGYMIGPYDLSASLGIPGQFDDPRVVEAITRIREAGKAAGKPGGIHVVDPDLKVVEQRISEGFSFIGYGMDIRILDTLCRDHLSKIKGLI
ncbi:MAG: 2,4-dihydroxyhept-2-ene-1,7-dioic acid aldolase [Rhodospirillales bacterium]|nr:2,4-dihydroxyhept-2-ene-1,7-dioic acid aldolase [Rhodospirillales bacterium]